MKISALPPCIFCPLLLALALLAGCRDTKVAAYRTPKEKDSALVTVAAAPAAAPTASPAMPAGHPDIGGATTPAAPLPGGMGAGMAGGPGLTWTAPAQWTAKPLSSMRKGSYAVTGADGATADLAITAFPGNVGGEVANVNRWRGQLQLTPLPDADAAASITHLAVNGLDIGVVDIVNAATPAQRLHGAMIPYQGATWFFKLLGPDSVVGPQHAAFLEFLKSVQPAAPAAINPAPAATP